MQGKKCRYLVILVPFLLSQVLNGQEIVTGLLSNPVIRDFRNNQSFTKGAPVNDTLELPFFEDFTNEGPFPSSEKWSDQHVYINNNYPVNQISRGVATLDALDSAGLLYENAGGSLFEADHLTSAPINLNHDPSEDVYLSFFYQPRGIGDAPEEADSLVLQFYSVGDDQWQHIWKANGSDLHNFKAVNIKIDKPAYLQKGFRFRFVNYASISSTLSDPAMAGNADHWHVDYIYLDKNRNEADTIPVDVAFTLPVRSVLNTYESMPWQQFRQVFLSEMGSFININYRNNDEVTRNVTRNFIIKDLYNNTDVHSFTAGATNIDPGQWVSYDANLIYTFDSGDTDSAMFRVRSVLITDEFDRKVNDTIDYYQVFKNYFAYDDGTAESGYGINGQGASNAMVSTRFRTYETDTLRAVMLAFNDSYQSSNRRYFNIAVWTDNNGMPGELIYEQEAMVEPGNEINSFKTIVLDDPVEIEEYFHVGWTQQSETFLNVSLDMNTPPEGRRHYYLNGSWTESEVPGSLMIRPVIGDKILASGITDIENNQPAGLKIWPNPVESILYIDTNEYQQYRNINIIIYDNSGRKIMSLESKDSIDVSRLPQGIYTLHISSGNMVLAYGRFIRM